MVISQISTLRTHLIWQLICGRPSVGRSVPFCRTAISQIPALRAHIWFLLWLIICGRPGAGRSTTCRTVISQILTLRAHILWQSICGRSSIGRSIPPLNSNFTDCYFESSPTQKAHMWQLEYWQIYPPSVEQWFHRLLLWELTYSDRSYVVDQV